jgi:hypothetical protein
MKKSKKRSKKTFYIFDQFGVAKRVTEEEAKEFLWKKRKS